MLDTQSCNRKKRRDLIFCVFAIPISLRAWSLELAAIVHFALEEFSRKGGRIGRANQLSDQVFQDERQFSMIFGSQHNKEKRKYQGNA